MLVRLLSWFIPQPSCDINARTKKRQTAVHVATEEGHVAVIEKLVGYGADLNAAAYDGGTPLRSAVTTCNMSSPDDASPQIKRVNNNKTKHSSQVN